MISMAYLKFVVNQVPITMLILANQVAYLPVLVETNARLTFHANTGIGTSSELS